MFRWIESRVLWGILLILGGVIFLLQSLGLFELGDLFWALVFAVAGIFFLAVFIPNRSNWWALIPGITLLSISLLITLTHFAPHFSETWGGSIVLGGIGLSFAIIYFMERAYWWAIIPAGVLLTLAFIAGLEGILGGFGTGGLFFLGLGLTFAIVAVVPTQEGQMRWAWIPAGIMLAMGLLLTAATQDYFNLIWPAALILLGLFMIYRTFLRRSS
jgi:hypothetical protein